MEIFHLINSVSPLGLAALLGYVVYLQVKNQRRVKELGMNHFGEVIGALSRIEHTLQAIREDVVYLRARQNERRS